MDPYNHLRSYGEALIDSVDPARAEAVAVRALAAPSAGLSLRRRLVAVAAASATFITGNLGVAFAADSAVPGDLLYGLDRAYEQLSELIGLSGDHSEERLEEALLLAAAGNTAGALDAVIESMAELRDRGNLEAPGLETALDAVAEARDRKNAEVDAETASAHAEKVVSIAHQIAAAAHSENYNLNETRESISALIEELKLAAWERGRGNAFGRDKDKGQGQPPVDLGNGGDRGNSGEAPKP